MIPRNAAHERLMGSAHLVDNALIPSLPRWVSPVTLATDLLVRSRAYRPNPAPKDIRW